MIPYGRQTISERDIDAVVQVLRSDYLTQGPKVPEFEEILAEYVGAPNAVAVNSATSALHIACLALDLGQGDYLWTSPISFVASANCAIYCGAKVDFVDIDPRTYNMCPKMLAHKLSKAEKTGRLPKIVVVVHFAGQSCEMEEFSKLADKYGFRLVEDASHAIGGSWQGATIGSCQYSDITIFSFHPVKIITTAEGGVLTTQNSKIARRLVDLRSHGVTKDTSRLERHAQGAWYYEQQSLGFNYRMTDLHAALGISQFKELDKFVSRRHELACRYSKTFDDLPLILPWQHPDSYSAYHLYPVQVADEAKISRHNLFNALRNAGVMVNVHYIPIHMQPFYSRMGFKEGDFPNAEAYYCRTLSLPLYASLTEVDQDYVISNLRSLLK